MDLDETWRRCAALEERLRREVPNGLPYPGSVAGRGVGRVVGADFRAPPPSRAAVLFVLERLLDAAAHALDFEAQREIADLIDGLGVSEGGA